MAKKVYKEEPEPTDDDSEPIESDTDSDGSTGFDED